MNNLSNQIISTINTKTNLYEYFRSLIDTIGVKTLLEQCDFKDVLRVLDEKYPGEKYKLFVCILERKENINDSVKYILSNDKLFQEVFKNSEQFFSAFNGINYETLKEIFNKMCSSNYRYSGFFINSLSNDVQLSLLNDNLDWNTFKWILPNLGESVQRNFYLNDKRALTYIENDVDNFNLKNLINRDYKFPDEILFSNVFFEKIKSPSLVEFRATINKLIQNNFHEDFFEKKFEQYKQEILKNYNPETDMFVDYQDMNEDNFWKKTDESTNKYILSDDLAEKIFSKDISDEQTIKNNLKKISSEKVSEVIIDSLFKDNYYNVIKNINEIVRYNSHFPNIIGEDFINLYKAIKDMDSMSYSEKMNIYDMLKDKHIDTIFYDHLRTMKDHSYDNMISKLLDTNTSQQLWNEQLSKQAGINVYELNGEEFNLMIRCSNKLDEEKAIRRNCYSLISDKNISAIDSSVYCYGYKNIDKQNILHVFENDSFSTNEIDDSTNAINRIMTPEEINDYNSYSEIQIVNKKNEDGLELLKPDYYIVFDEIKEKDILESKRLNLPIVKINTKMYKNNASLNVSSLLTEETIYVNNTNDEYKASRSR